MARLRQTLGGRSGGPLTHSSYTTRGDTAPIDANGFAETVDRTPGLQRGKWNGVRLVRGVGLKPPGDDRGER